MIARWYPYVGTGVVIAVLAAYGWGRMSGSASEARDCKLESQAVRIELQAAREVAKARAHQVEIANLELAGAVIERDAARKQRARVVERTVVEEVIRYVEKNNAARCVLDADFVHIHDTAAAHRVPEASEPAGEPDGGAAATATAGEVLKTVTNNYATCHAIRHQLIALQEWTAGVR